jgi:hypothetical protein
VQRDVRSTLVVDVVRVGAVDRCADLTGALVRGNLSTWSFRPITAPTTHTAAATKPATSSSPEAQYQPTDGLRMTERAAYVLLPMLIDDLLASLTAATIRLRGVDRLSCHDPSGPFTAARA